MSGVGLESTNVSPLTAAFITLFGSVLLGIAAFLAFRYTEGMQERTARMMRLPDNSYFRRMRRVTRNLSSAFLAIMSIVIFVLAIREITVS